MQSPIQSMLYQGHKVLIVFNHIEKQSKDRTMS
jgi:hypothetical protein